MITHDPDATLDYQWDWADWLAADGDTITSHTITIVAGGVTEAQASSRTATAVTAWLTGGVAGTHAQVTCRIVTAAGRQDERTFTLAVRQR